jgi:hypothetical protein
MRWLRFPRKKKNDQTSGGDATGTATGALADVGSSTTEVAAPYKAIPEVNDEGCTVIYEGGEPIRAE